MIDAKHNGPCGGGWRGSPTIVTFFPSSRSLIMISGEGSMTDMIKDGKVEVIDRDKRYLQDYKIYRTPYEKKISEGI